MQFARPTTKSFNPLKSQVPVTKKGKEGEWRCAPQTLFQLGAEQMTNQNCIQMRHRRQLHVA